MSICLNFNECYNLTHIFIKINNNYNVYYILILYLHFKYNLVKTCFNILTQDYKLLFFCIYNSRYKW